LPVDERIAEREVLRHSYERIIYGDIAVRMVFSQCLADDTHALFVGLVVFDAELLHSVEYPAMDGLQSVAYVGQGAPDDNAHRVIYVGVLHLLFDVSWQ
jgi:hypothetical protein